MAKRCLISAYYFPPTGGAGVQRIVKLIKYLSRKDWRFTVLTADENSRFQPRDPSLLKELPDTIKIIRLPAQLPGGKSGLFNLPFFKEASYGKRWLGAWFSLPDMRKNWIAPAEAAILEELKQKRYDCVLVSAPPYSLALLAAQLQPKVLCPLILDLRDPWSTHPYKIHPTRWHKQKNKKMEFAVMRSIRFGISAYSKLLDLYEKEISGFQRENWAFIPNGYDEEDFGPFRPPELEEKVFHIGYSGTIHSAINNPAPLFKIMAAIKRQNPIGSKKIVFHHVGKSLINLHKIAEKYKVQEQLQLWGYRPHREALRILRAMDAFLLLHSDRFADSQYIVAGKVYEYLRMQKPILALVPEEGEAAELIRETDSGCVISPTNSEKIAATLKSWATDIPPFRFKDINRFSREFQAEQFLAVFERAISDF